MNPVILPFLLWRVFNELLLGLQGHIDRCAKSISFEPHVVFCERILWGVHL